MNREDYIRRLLIEPAPVVSADAPHVVVEPDGEAIPWSNSPEVGRFYDFDGEKTRLFCRAARAAFSNFVAGMLVETDEAFCEDWKPRTLRWLADYGVQGVVWSNTPGGALPPLHGWTLIVYFTGSSSTRKMFGDAKVQVEV